MPRLFEIPDEIRNLPDPPPIAAIARLEAYQVKVDCINYPIVFGITGVCVGVLCALLALKSKAIGTVLAGLLGGVLGAVGAYLAAIVAGMTRSASGSDIVLIGITLDAMKQGILNQACIWGLMGLGIGIGIGVAVQGGIGAVKGGLAGLLGGAFAALIFTFGVAIIAPNSSTNHVFPLATSEQIALSASRPFALAALSASASDRERKRFVSDGVAASFRSIRILSLPRTSSLVAPIERDDLAPFHIELQSVKHWPQQ